MLVAFNLKDAPVCLSKLAAPDPAKLLPHLTVLDPMVINTGQSPDIERFEVTREWLAQALSAFDPLAAQKLKVARHAPEITDSQIHFVQERSNKLSSLLRARLPNHLQRRIVFNYDRLDLWPFEWAELNIPVVSAIMVALGLVRESIISISHNSNCLLAKLPDAFIPANGPAGKLEGSYLYYDKEEACPVRSGKVVGRSIEERDNEHKKASSKNNSKFYRLYPESCLPGCKGLFNELDLYCGLAFSREVPSVLETTEYFAGQSPSWTD
jgi:hypothetical protein